MTINSDELNSLGDAFYGAVSSRFAHGLLIVSAPESRDAHEDWDPAVDVVHATPDSLYVAVQQAATASVWVACVAAPYVPNGLERLFAGEINLPRAELAIYDPNETVNLRLAVDFESNRVEIYGNNTYESTELVIVLSGRERVGSVEGR